MMLSILLQFTPGELHWLTSIYRQIIDEYHHYQLYILLACLVITYLIITTLKKYNFTQKLPIIHYCQRLLLTPSPSKIYFIILTLLLWVVQLCLHLFKINNYFPLFIITITCSIIVLLPFCHILLSKCYKAKLLILSVLTIVILYLLDLLAPLQNKLKSWHIPIGDTHINVLNITNGCILLIVLLWSVTIIRKLLDRVIKNQNKIPASIQVLINKIIHILLYVAIFTWVLKVAGIPLGGLTIFSGALGLGLGFGLQKVISNLISGVIILIDKSIKPGDVVEIDGSYGLINTFRTRYVSLLTRDQKEILIPNEDFITQKIVNCSFSDSTVRIKANIGIAYDSDIEKAMQLATDAIKEIPRVLPFPEPICLLVNFGDFSIDLQIRFWINDPSLGISNVRSAVLLAIWKSFQEHQIHIPFPQREVVIKPHSELTLKR